MFIRVNKQELKTHLPFAGILLLALAVTAGLKVWDGTDIKTAIWQTLTGIRLMEAALMIGFWYHAVTGKRQDEKKSGLTTLHHND